MDAALLTNAWNRLRERGPLNAGRHLLHWLSDVSYERFFSIDTRVPARLTEFGYRHEEFVDYEAPAYRALERAFAHLQPIPGRSVFIDFGCGRGRAMAVAARLPFQRIIGVELVPQLLEAARENLARASSRLVCTEFEFVSCNAVDYRLPEDVDHIYFFNPFRGSVLGSVLSQIHTSWTESPRPLTVIYLNPDDFDRQLAGTSWLRPVHRFQAYPDTRVAIYRTAS